MPQITELPVPSESAEEVVVASDTRERPKQPKPIRTRARPRTVAMKRLTKEQQRIGELLYPERTYWRPTSRGECANVTRPCPYVSCKYHLYLDVHPKKGSIKINFPDREVWELEHSCALDVADSGGTTLEDVGEILNLTRERVRQLEAEALRKLEAAGGREMVEYLTAQTPTPGGGL